MEGQLQPFLKILLQTFGYIAEAQVRCVGKLPVFFCTLLIFPEKMKVVKKDIYHVLSFSIRKTDSDYTRGKEM